MADAKTSPAVFESLLSVAHAYHRTCDIMIETFTKRAKAEPHQKHAARQMIEYWEKRKGEVEAILDFVNS